MPSNKKKKSSKSNKAERAAKLASRAERNLAIDSLPPFGPVAETQEEEIKRVLGYKHLSIQYAGHNAFIPTTERDMYADKPVAITRKDDKTFMVQILTPSMEPVEDKFTEFNVHHDYRLRYDFLPDYDRNAADYPVAHEIMSLISTADRSRRVKKRFKDVPQDIKEVYASFMELGEGIHVKGSKTTSGPKLCPEDPTGTAFRFDANIVGVEYSGENEQGFHLFVSKKGHSMAFSGCMMTKCLQKYQLELALLLIYECHERIATGNAEIADGVTCKELVNALSKVLLNMYAEKGRYSDLCALQIFRLSLAIEEKFSLTVTTGIECELGEALEACGFHSQAALVYAEAATYLHQAGHPKTSTVLNNAGLAWKRHGDYEAAESYYALSLQSLFLFVRAPDEYRRQAFNTFYNLFILYYDPQKNIAPLKLLATLHALLNAAGCDTNDPGEFATDGTPVLRVAIQGASEEQTCRALQLIISKTTSTKSLRDAILSCANRGSRTVDAGSSCGSDGDRQERDHAREFLKGNIKSTGFIATCSACGVAKEEKHFANCACKNAYYCDAKCQKSDWLFHKNECNAARKTQKKKSGERQCAL